MATLSHAQAVKSLNKSPGRRRFIFKNFSQRLEEVDIDVYKSLDTLKAEPSEGSSFLRDCLVQWRELNTAEDFISYYEEMMPLVQNLPLVLLHKELIFTKLLCRLQLKARLSLEPILRLIAALSRDLLEDFKPFLPRIADSLVCLLKSGADREPDIIEQIFTSWSSIMMYLQKYLIRDVVYALKVTVSLRYYPKDYVQEFMAEAMSFLLRNAPIEQLIKGVRKILLEVAKKPLPTRKSGVSALLWYAMRGTSSKFHSRADQVLRILMDDSIFSIDDFNQERNTVVEVISTSFERLCEELETRELNILWDRLCHEITDCISNQSLLRLKRLLSLLISPLKVNSGRKVSDYRQMMKLVDSLLQKFIIFKSGTVNLDDHSYEVIDVILQLMLCIIDGLQCSNETSVISVISKSWSPVFELKNPCLLNFIKDLIQKSPHTLHAFRENIIRAMNDLIDISNEDVIYMILCLGERLQGQNPRFLLETSEGSLLKIQGCLEKVIIRWIKTINDFICGEATCDNFCDDNNLAHLWGAITCYACVFDINENSSLLMDLVDAIDHLLENKADIIASHFGMRWQSLIGEALSSYSKIHLNKEGRVEETKKVLLLAKRYKLSSHVLFSVAGYLDSIHGSKSVLLDLNEEKVEQSVATFAENLSNSNKLIRISTLKLLRHYEVAQTFQAEEHSINVIELLLSIEETPLAISTSRKVVLLISRIQMSLSAGNISEAYVPLLLNGLIGIFYNRFTSLWDPSLECLAVLISKHVTLTWDTLLNFLEQCQSTFLSCDQVDKRSAESSSNSSDIVERFNTFVTPVSDSTSCSTVLSLLLKSLQKVASIVESRSRKIIPLFLKFLGYENTDSVRVRSFKLHGCNGKEWKVVLKEWLSLLKLMRNPKSFYQSSFYKEVLVIRLLDENDAEIQMKALDCLLLWKDEFLLAYEHNLKNLICSKNMREELTTWSISEGSGLINEHHRADLVPYIIRLLIPKVRNLKMFASRKLASVQHRKSVLSFIAQLEVNDLFLFYELLVKPLQTTSMGSNDSANLFWESLENSMVEFQATNILNWFTVENITALSWKKRNGFLHVIEDVIRVFDHTRVTPFLDLLMGCVVRILESSTSSIDGTNLNQTMTSTEIKQYKDLRSLCLKIISLILGKYEDHDFGNGFWDLFFLSVKPLIVSFKQEGSSSEKPSSLFSCFIAMSRSHKLVSLLFRENNLVRDIVSILTVKKASEAILSCTLEFIANLLSLNIEFDETILEALVCSLHYLFQSDNMIKRKLVKSPGERELGIFNLLSKYIKDPLLAGKFIDIMLPFLEQRSPNSDACAVAVQVIRDIIPLSGSNITEKILRASSPLLISAERDLRLCICDLLYGLAITDPSIKLMAELLQELNAISTIEMGERDFDTIINAYGKIGPDFFQAIQKDHALVILSHCIYDMSSDEIILRNSAYSSLLSFIKFSSLILGREVSNVEETEAMWTGACIQQIIHKFLLKHLADAMIKETPVQKLWIEMLRKMVLKLPEVVNLNSLKALSSVDAEVDFFNNILHIQKHRRAKALLRFKNVIDGGNFAEGITTKIFVPLFLNMLFNVQDGKGEHVRTACVDALASVSGHMQWKSYYSLLLKCFREMTLKPDKQKILSRLVCSIFDQFHFSDSINITEIQTCLQKNVLLKINKLLSSNSDKVNVNISLAALKLLKLLPGDIMESQLPSIIHRISNFLKNRLESIREEARSALAACLKELGLEYLQFVVGVLKATLKRGYEMHVLGYTLHFILSKSLVNAPGKLDYCLRDLLFVVENDILGDVAEEKDVEKIAVKMKETRKRKSLETLTMVSQNITFKTHAMKLLLPITAKLQRHVTNKVKTKLESMLKHIAVGIESNPSVDQTDLFIFVYSLIEDGVPIENHSEENSGSNSQCFHLITVFALGVLHSRIKKAKLNTNNEELLSMLDPFVKLLGNCLSSKYEDILSASLRCLAPLIRLPLPSLESQAEKIKATLLDISQNSINTNSPLMQTCLGLLTQLLRNTKITLSTDQLNLLIQFPIFVDLEKNPSFVALSLLKAIVKRKLVVPEIYDVVKGVARLIVTSQVEPVRKKSSQILLQFLLDYRLSKERLQQHLDVLINNLRYEHSSGRESVLEMFHAIIKKFPKSIIDEQSDKLFVFFVHCLANEFDNKVRSMTGAALKLLLGSVSPHILHSSVEKTLTWYTGENQKVWSTGAQVLGLLVEVMKEGFQRYVDGVIPVIRRILQSSIDVVNSSQQELFNEPTIYLWKEAYYSLVLFEKILNQFPDLSLDKDLEDIWESICELLIRPHMWLRTISSRLVAFHFTKVTQSKREAHDNSLQTFSLMRPSGLFRIAVFHFCQLRAQINEDSSNSVITQNLVFSICGVHSLMRQNDPQVFWSTIDLIERTRFLKALNLLDPKNGKSIFASLVSGGHHQNEQENSEQLRYILVSNLLTRMGKVVLHMDSIQMKIVFNCFIAICSQMGPDDFQHYASEMVLPLYKVCEGFSGRVIPDDVKQLAQEVLKKIENTLGTKKFVEVYNPIRKKLKAKRDKRKHEEKVMAVVDPMRNAKRKLRVAAKHSANKKRKIMTMKIGKRKR